MGHSASMACCTEVALESQDTSAAITELKSMGRIFQVALHKGTCDEQLGLHVDLTNKTFIYVVEVRSGAMRTWNDSVSKDRRIRAGDAILEVNGVRGSSDRMVERLQTERQLRLTVLRSESDEVVDLEKECSLGRLSKLSAMCNPVVRLSSCSRAGKVGLGSVCGGRSDVFASLPLAVS